MKLKEKQFLKIGHLISNYFPSVGGAQAFVHYIADKSILKGHKTVVMTPARGGTDDKIFKYKIVRLNPLLNRLLFINFSLGKIYIEHVLLRLQEKYNFDIWQVTVGYPLGAASVDFFNRKQIPSILRCAGEDIQILSKVGYGYRLNKKVDTIVRNNYKKFTALIAAGDGTTKDYLSLGVPKEKVFIISNGVDCAKFDIDIDKRKVRDELGVSENQKLIMTVGRNHPKKGFNDIPQIIKHLLKKGAKFRWLLVGKGCEKIKVLADKENLSKYLIVKEVKADALDGEGPEIPNKKLIEYYKASDIFVFPTLIELFAKVLIEAMAAGLPIVTTDAPGVDDIIRDNENGLKCRIGDIVGMAESIFKLFSDDLLARRLSENALQDAKNYDWSKVTDKYFVLYRRLLNMAE
jgi:glycosyltransferase involved in cell wall biosynthesis